MPHGHGQDDDAAPAARPGANARPAQWQTPHLPETEHAPPPDAERDVDLVERAFAEGFAASSDPTSFLRLAGVPFEGRDADGRHLVLLRVEQETKTDVGSVTPQLGGGDFRYAPMPARLTSRRERLRFIYFDGADVIGLAFEEARALARLPAPTTL